MDQTTFQVDLDQTVFSKTDLVLEEKLDSKISSEKEDNNVINKQDKAETITELLDEGEIKEPSVFQSFQEPQRTSTR